VVQQLLAGLAHAPRLVGPGRDVVVPVAEAADVLVAAAYRRVHLGHQPAACALEARLRAPSVAQRAFRGLHRRRGASAVRRAQRLRAQQRGPGQAAGQDGGHGAVRR